MTRKYSVIEIEQMRQALRTILIQPMVSYYADEKNKEIEAQLQTYMLNGTDPEELEKRAAECMRQYQEFAAQRRGDRG